MGKHAIKPAMESAAKISELEASARRDSFYSRIWDGATDFVIAVTGRATGNIGDLFPKRIQTDSIPKITAAYRSQHLEHVSGNWNVLSPRSDGKDSNE